MMLLFIIIVALRWRRSHPEDSAEPRGATKERQMCSKKPPFVSEPLFFSARHVSKNPGFVLRPLPPYAIASLGVALKTNRLKSIPSDCSDGNGSPFARGTAAKGSLFRIRRSAPNQEVPHPRTLESPCGNVGKGHGKGEEEGGERKGLAGSGMPACRPPTA